MEQPTVSIGIVTYNSQRYLQGLIDSLERQTYNNWKLYVFDNASQDETISLLRTLAPRAHVIAHHKNLGFGTAHNRLISISEGEYYLCLNPDIMLDDDCIEQLVAGINQHPQAGSVGPKTYKLDGQTLSPTSLIDTVGLAMSRAHCAYEIGCGEPDRIEWCEPREVFGISGSMVLFRREALKRIAYQEAYFDEAMFMYKEDVDIAYRLQLGDYQAWIIPTAHAYHVRSTPAKGAHNFFKKSPQVITWSGEHHVRMVLKNMPDNFPTTIKAASIFRCWIICCYTTLYNPTAGLRIFKMLTGITKVPKTPVRTDLPRLEALFVRRNT